MRLNTEKDLWQVKKHEDSPCECEHIDHMNREIIDRSSGYLRTKFETASKHPYGGAAAQHIISTANGSFLVCTDCKETCLKDLI